MPEVPPLKEGDLVQLTSGGPAMSLQELVGDRALCMWFDSNGALQERHFILSSLRPADEGPRE